MNPAQVLTHVKRYRRFYALGAVWAVVMVAAPVVQEATAPPRVEVDTPELAAVAPTAAAPVAPPAAVSPGVFGPPSLAPMMPTSVPDFSLPAAAPSTETEPPTPAAGLLPIPAELGQALAPPPLPGLPVPPPPPEFSAVAGIGAPTARIACSPVGLAGVLVAVLAPAAYPIPLTSYVPFLFPVYLACGSFPNFGDRTVCPVDDQVAVDTSGLMPAPAPAGLFIDTIEGLEDFIHFMGGPAPSAAEVMRQQQGCRLDA